MQREEQKAIFKKAMDEGKDPEEALRVWLKEQQVDDSGNESEGSAQPEGGEKEGAEKLKFKNRKGEIIFRLCHSSIRLIFIPNIASDGGTSAAARRNRDNAHLCSTKECQNLLQPEVRVSVQTYISVT